MVLNTLLGLQNLYKLLKEEIITFLFSLSKILLIELNFFSKNPVDDNL
jgi:hypothetical protein